MTTSTSRSRRTTLYPTAIKITLILRNEKLIAEVSRLAAAFRAKGDEFLKLPKMGRTELQDAVPMTLGQEFHAFADALDSEVTLLRQAETALYTINMGATAIGSQINVPKGYPKLVADELARMLHKPIVPAQDLFERRLPALSIQARIVPRAELRGRHGQVRGGQRDDGRLRALLPAGALHVRLRVLPQQGRIRAGP